MLTLFVALLPASLLARDRFGDVPPQPEYSHHDNIDLIADAGITIGCGGDPTRYCPNGYVTRGEMATFLARVAGLGNNPPVVNAKTVGITAPVPSPSPSSAPAPGSVPVVAGQSFVQSPPSYCSSCSTFRVTITDVQRRSDIPATQYNSAITAQGAYIVVLMRATNTGSNPDNLRSFGIKDQQGRTFTYDSSATSKATSSYNRRSPFTTLQPSFGDDEVIVFDVATDATGFTTVP